MIIKIYLCLNVRSATVNRKKNKIVNEVRRKNPIINTVDSHSFSPKANFIIVKLDRETVSNSITDKSKNVTSDEFDRLVAHSNSLQNAGTNDNVTLKIMPI